MRQKPTRRSKEEIQSLINQIEEMRRTQPERSVEDIVRSVGMNYGSYYKLRKHIGPNGELLNYTPPGLPGRKPGQVKRAPMQTLIVPEPNISFATDHKRESNNVAVFYGSPESVTEALRKLMGE